MTHNINDKGNSDTYMRWVHCAAINIFGLHNSESTLVGPRLENYTALITRHYSQPATPPLIYIQAEDEGKKSQKG